MKILFVSHRFPFPPNEGGKIRAFHMIRHLARRHEVCVASLAHSAEEVEKGVGIREYCESFIMESIGRWRGLARAVLRLPRAEPSSMGYFYCRDFGRRIRAELDSARYDLIVVHCSSVAQYVDHVTDIPKVLDFADMDSQKWIAYGPYKRWPLSLGYYLEGFKLQLAETRLAKTFDASTCTTPAEVATLRGFGTGAVADWFPNGVDIEAFRPSDEPYDPDNLCFVGRMDYFPNEECMVQFCAETLPLIRRARPAVTLSIVGASPSKNVRDLGSIPGVKVTGSVPEVQPYLHKAAVAIAPLNIARGVQNKILEAMASGVPVVCSRLAAAGVDAVPGEHLLAASTPREHADCILDLLEKPEERRRFAAAGRGRIVSHHTWEHAMERMDRIIADCLDRRSAGQGRKDHPGVEITRS